MSNIQASPDIAQVKDLDEAKRFITLYLQEVSETVNGDLDFQSNFNATTVSITFSAADTNTQVVHNLGRIPIGYIVCGLTAAMVVYDGALANTSSVINFRSSAVGTAKILVY